MEKEIEPTIIDPILRQWFELIMEGGRDKEADALFRQWLRQVMQKGQDLR